MEHMGPAGPDDCKHPTRDLGCIIDIFQDQEPNGQTVDGKCQNGIGEGRKGMEDGVHDSTTMTTG